MKQYFILFIGFLLISYQQINSQEVPYQKDIQNFQKTDKSEAPVLFVGSSSFTLWKDVQDYFPGFRLYIFL